MSDEKPRLFATVFSDYICPFCYVGDARLNRLREDYELRINWCFLEIHPETAPEGENVTELGYEPETWRRMMDTLDVMAEEEGLVMAKHDFTTNSRKALLLAEAAKSAGAEVFYRLHQRLFEAYLSEGLNIGDVEILSRLASEAGMSAELIESAWADSQFAERLAQNHKVAAELDIKATPTIFIGEQRLDGAVPTEQLRAAARAVAGSA